MTMKMKAATLVTMSAMLSTARQSQAVLTLTPTGIADGFGLTTFATGFPISDTVGPLGVAFTSSGSLMVSDFTGNVRLFPSDTDGQTVAATPPVRNYGVGTIQGFAQDGYVTYATDKSAGTLVKMSTGGDSFTLVASGFTAPLGLVFDSFTDHLILAAQGGIHDIDPAGIVAARVIESGVGCDGLALSADGGTIYGATNSQIVGWNTSTGAKVFTAGIAGGGTANGNYLTAVDGTAIGTGSFAGYIFGNTNNGDLVQVNLSTGTQTLIASGGDRGDFVTVDRTNGSLLLTQSSTIMRLTGPPVVVTHSIIGLSSSTNTLYGTQITNGTGANKGIFTSGTNTLTVNGSNGSYRASQVTGINGGAGLASGYVAISGFNPGTDTEIYALDVLVGGQPATASEINTIVADINSAHGYGYQSSIAYSQDPGGAGAFSLLSPTEPYNLFLKLTDQTVGSGYFGFDMTQDPTYGASASAANTATVVAVGVVPEPGTLSLGAIIGASTLSRRKRRNS